MSGDRKLGAAMLACLLLTLGASLGALLGANALAEQGRRDTELKFCQVVAYARDTEVRKLNGYREDPPQTEAGKGQLEQAEASLRAYRDLERTLSCPHPE